MLCPVYSQPPPRHCQSGRGPWWALPPKEGELPRAAGGSHPAAAPRQLCSPHIAALWLLGAFQGHSKFLGSAEDFTFYCPAEEKVRGAQGSSQNHFYIFLHLRAQSSCPRAGRGSRSLSGACFLSRREALGLPLAHRGGFRTPRRGCGCPVSHGQRQANPLSSLTQNPAPAPRSAQCAQNFVSFIHLLSNSRVFRARFYHPGSCGSKRWVTCPGS